MGEEANLRFAHIASKTTKLTTFVKCIVGVEFQLLPITYYILSVYPQGVIRQAMVGEEAFRHFVLNASVLTKLVLLVK